MKKIMYKPFEGGVLRTPYLPLTNIPTIFSIENLDNYLSNANIKESIFLASEDLYSSLYLEVI